MFLEKFDLKDRVAVVTGGGQGIGVSCAEALAEAGARVVVADLSAQKADAGRDVLVGKGFDVDTAVFDVSNSQAVDEAARAEDLDERLREILSYLESRSDGVNR